MPNHPALPSCARSLICWIPLLAGCHGWDKLADRIGAQALDPHLANLEGRYANATEGRSLLWRCLMEDVVNEPQEAHDDETVEIRRLSDRLLRIRRIRDGVVQAQQELEYRYNHRYIEITTTVFRGPFPALWGPSTATKALMLDSQGRLQVTVYRQGSAFVGFFPVWSTDDYYGVRANRVD